MKNYIVIGFLLFFFGIRVAYKATKPPAPATTTSYINRFLTDDTVVVQMDLPGQRGGELPVHLKLGLTIGEVLKALKVELPAMTASQQQTLQSPKLLIIFLDPSGSSRYIVFRDGKLYGQDSFNADETARIESQRPKS